MNQVSDQVVYVGIDVSKLSFDTGSVKGKSSVYKNSLQGFKAFVKGLNPGTVCVMEATGPYYLKLAFYLHDHGVDVSVVNPLVIKRFAQMRMMKAKTDKADAKLIALYAEKETPKLWQPPKAELLEIRQDRMALEGLIKQRQITTGQLESVQVQPVESRDVLKALKSVLKAIEKQINKLEEAILSKVTSCYGREYELLTSIPGVGMKTAVALLVSTGAFTSFDSYKQVASYIGMCPRIYQSGSSIKGKGHITKMGNPRVRSVLYMAACSAKRYNLACQQLYDRLVQKGKAKKVALIAVANKLIKQAFAIVKQNNSYNPEYYLATNPNRA